MELNFERWSRQEPEHLGLQDEAGRGAPCRVYVQVGGGGVGGGCREFKAHQICGLRKKMIILSFDKDSKA